MLIVGFIFIQVLLFGGLIFVLHKVLTQNVVSATKHIEELNSDYANKELDLNRQLEDVKKKSEDIINKAREEAQSVKTQILEEAEVERNKLLQQTHTHSEELIQQADKSGQMLLAEINERIAKEAIDKACKLIEEALPEQFKLDIHKRWIEDLLESDFTQFERLKIPKELQEVKIVSAFPLESAQRKNLLKKLEGILKRKLSLKEEVNPNIVAGFIVTIGNLVFDGSLRNKINERAKNA